MTGLQQIVNLRHGQQIQVVSPIGDSRVMKVMIGDALMRGTGKQIWLIHEETGQYLRKLPQREGEKGKALFYSNSDLFTCIENRDFYFA